MVETLDKLQQYLPAKSEAAEEALYQFAETAIQYSHALDDLAASFQEQGVFDSLEVYEEVRRYERERLPDVYVDVWDMAFGDADEPSREAGRDIEEIKRSLEDKWYDVMREGTSGNMSTHDLRDLFDEQIEAQ